MSQERFSLHPLVVSVIALPAVVGVLVAHRPLYAIAVAMLCLVFTAFLGLRTAASVTAGTLVMGAMLWCGMAAWLPGDVALRGALRLTSVSVLMVVPTLFLRMPVLLDTLIDRFHVPYRFVDVVLLGSRFVTLLRTDIRAARELAVLRSRRQGICRMVVGSSTIIAVLVASFRHSEYLAVAMDARGFGARSTRTVHHSRPIRALDIAVLAAVWVLSVTLAVVLEL